jgi:hypothetical protein
MAFGKTLMDATPERQEIGMQVEYQARADWCGKNEFVKRHMCSWEPCCAAGGIVGMPSGEVVVGRDDQVHG